MNITKKIIMSLVLAIVTVSLSVEARRDQVREHKQQQRIRQGVKSGELTKGEAKKLIKGQRRIDRAQRKAMADGEVTAKEKLKINKMQNHQSKEIYQEKHDDQNRE